MRLVLASSVLLALCACRGQPEDSTSHVAFNQSGNATRAAIDMGQFCIAWTGKGIPELASSAAAVTLTTVAGGDSGVVVDGGQRVLKSLSVTDCGKGTGATVRLTEDQGGGLSGYEVFVRNDSTREIVGLAVAADGSELAIVPKELAFDKHGNKRTANPDGSVNELVHTRMGCFSCHSNVSFDYGMPGADEFWQNARPTERFAAIADSGPTGAPTAANEAGDANFAPTQLEAAPDVGQIQDPPL